MAHLTPSRARLTGLVLSLLVTIALLPVVAASVSGSLPGTAYRLEVSGASQLGTAGMMPGDRRPAGAITLRAIGTLRYRVHVDYAGSPALAAALELRMTRPDGTLLYAGPLRAWHWVARISRREPAFPWRTARRRRSSCRSRSR